MQCRTWSLMAAVLLGLLLANMAVAQSDPPTATPGRSAGNLPAIGKQRQKVADQISRLSAQHNDESASGEQSEEIVSLLHSLVALYAQHEHWLERRGQLEIQSKEVAKELESLDHFNPSEPKPYSLLFLESLRDQLAEEEEREQAITADKKSAERLLAAAHETLDEQEEDAKKPANPGESSEGGLPSPDALKASIAREQIAMRQAEVQVQTLRLEVSGVLQKQLAKKIEVVEKDSSFTSGDRDKQLERLAGAEAELKRQRRDFESRLQQVEVEKKAALKELAEKKAPHEAEEAASEAWRTASEAYQSAIVLLDQQLEDLVTTRRFWRRRYDLLTDKVEADTMTRWLEDLDEFRDQLKDLSVSLENRHDGIRNEQNAIARHKLDTQSDAATEWLAFRTERLEELSQLTEARLAEIKSTDRTLERFHGELEKKLKENPGSWAAILTERFKGFLGQNVSEDEEQTVTIGRMLVLLLYVIGGILLAYLLSRLIGRRLLRRLGVHHGTADALKSILFYGLCVMFGVMAFQMLDIPLAAFAFLGGAAAIAIGFGSQDIMNNFMSGMILLAEQPIRVGDVVQIGDVQGLVLHIGLRSTRLQTDANHELIVPNKTLLDEQVTNLTLSDNFVQLFVTVTLDRSVPVPPAIKRMQDVVFAHPLVIKSPRPAVLLTEFDPYWSVFEVHFWLEYASFMTCAMVKSQILEQISDLYPDGESSGSSTAEAEPGEAPEKTPAAENGAAQPAARALPAEMAKMGNAVIVKQLKRVRGLGVKA